MHSMVYMGWACALLSLVLGGGPCACIVWYTWVAPVHLSGQAHPVVGPLRRVVLSKPPLVNRPHAVHDGNEIKSSSCTYHAYVIHTPGRRGVHRTAIGLAPCTD